MEVGISTLIETLGLLLGGGGLGYLLTLKSSMAKARGEAHQIENEATKSVQDIYQEMIEDVRRDRIEQKGYISELKEERKHLRQDRDECRKENARLFQRLNNMDEKILSLEKVVARQARKLELINPFLCSRDCPDRLHTTFKELLAIKKISQVNDMDRDTKDNKSK